MANDTNLKVDGLEYGDIRSNLEQYLKGQSTFSDYNFESSGISNLLDLLAYNTYYNSFYTNMASAESFLSTAQKRSSVTALADTLGYVPRSATSANLPGTITVTPTGTPATVSVPYGTKFKASIDGVSYVFSVSESLVITPTLGVYSLSNVTLKEGTYTSEQYLYDASNPEKKIIINN